MHVFVQVILFTQSGVVGCVWLVDHHLLNPTPDICYLKCGSGTISMDIISELVRNVGLRPH
jgi:hypothetical protein